MTLFTRNGASAQSQAKRRESIAILLVVSGRQSAAKHDTSFKQALLIEGVTIIIETLIAIFALRHFLQCVRHSIYLRCQDLRSQNLEHSDDSIDAQSTRIKHANTAFTSHAGRCIMCEGAWRDVLSGIQAANPTFASQLLLSVHR